MVADSFRVPRTLRGAANLRQPLSSVAPVAAGYERSLRPSLTWFSRPESTRATEGGRVGASS
jgi:hypothetical protein